MRGTIMNPKMLRILALACALALPAAARVSAAEPYRIGAVFSITGPGAWLGEPERDTAKMLAEEINAAGGINGHPIELIIEDDAGEEAKSVLAAKKLIDRDKVLAIIGPSTSGPSMALKKIANEKETPLVSCAAAITIVTPPSESRWVFKTAQSDLHAVQRLFEHMKAKGIAKVAIITVSNGFGDSGRKELLAAAPAFGITIVADERYGQGDNDMTAQLTKIKGSGAQALVNWSIGPPQVIVTKNVQQLGIKIPFYQSHGWGNIKNIEQAGPAAEGVLAVLGQLMVAEGLPDAHPQKKVLTAYKKAYETRFKKDVSAFGGYAWDALSLVADALKTAGPDRARIRDHIAGRKNFVGISGIFNFSPEDHNGLTKDAFEILKVKDARFVLSD
jgi:branched-chain amino acid transport system substrate-binding protein